MVATEKKLHDIFNDVVLQGEARQKALQALENLQIPTTKHEEWKYTNLKGLLNETWQLASKNAISEIEKHFVLQDTYRMVFINGFLQESHSILPKQVEMLSIVEAEKKGKLQGYFAKTLDIEKDYFNALNTAFAQNGYFLHIPAKVVLDKPLVIYHLSSGESTAFLQRNVIIAEPSSEVQVINMYLAEGEHVSFASEVTEIFVSENAHFSFYKLQNEQNKIYRVDTTQVEQQNYSHFASYTFSLAGHLVRNNLNMLIEGEHCETLMYGLSYLKGKSHIDHHTLADHRKPNSYSNELYKGLFDESATGVFNGKIYVRPEAQKTNAYQQNRNVLLSEQASIYTKPQLEIWADDVKCSHGATTGKLDETALFYMRSRGISEAVARKILLQAFAEEVIEKIPFEPLQEYIKNLL
ncbi:Fe-S cluster assembly protein SufD [Raineya orbicola]|jgi:Fe-S cluster assembly protein SufD|uniref:SufD: FeS assembly protein SufD n=1 Tax=Raineya orbicola TaxID=2016530 RepID=A0A2N3IGF2_9BACT|nr:Fe-S cluster assembly protein SufD [Raineya orbicola]PKQ69313.1 sufD: FeS assembly protein SufD [Raineya orbicola]